jgi:BirA family biotin operon repressor/biotin-[acetyl-CoA-carboxylase] ligase
MAKEGAPEGTVVIAGEQAAGKGRHGRNWSSPAGTGLYLSVILRPNLPQEQLWQTAFVAAVAAAEAIAETSGLPVQVKWPNDVLVNGRKVCGILIEETRGLLIVGIGINVNTLEFPSEIAEKATSIALELGHPVEDNLVDEALLSALGRRYEQYLTEGFGPIFQAWGALDCTVGSRVFTETIEGTALGMSSDGNLLVEAADGVARLVTAGDVIIVDA